MAFFVLTEQFIKSKIKFSRIDAVDILLCMLLHKSQKSVFVATDCKHVSLLIPVTVL